MITLKPFKAYRPIPQYVTNVAALPYDVMSTEEAVKIAKDNPYCFLHVDKPEIDLTPSTKENIYTLAHLALEFLIQKGILIQEDTPCLYLYVLATPYTTQYGIVGLASAKEYDENKIKKHENTRAQKKQDRINHIRTCRAHTGPIFLAYKGFEELTHWTHHYALQYSPLYNFTLEDNVHHRLYKIGESSDISYILSAFAQMDTLYIADGHHRAAAASAVAKIYREKGLASLDSEYFLAAIFPKDQLHIMDYNRVLKDESGLTKEVLFQTLQLHFNIEALDVLTYKPEAKHIFGMRYQKKWYKLTLKREYLNTEDIIQDLDVNVLDQLILKPIFKIKDSKTDERIDFIGGVRGIEELNKQTEKNMDIAFSLYPTTMDELIHVADSNQLMPPKSTWFEPKLLSGLLVHQIK